MRALFFSSVIQSLKTMFDHSHWSTILLPRPISPASNGWSWEKAKGWEEFAMPYEDELTDEEAGSEEDD